jgi:hypothetical protein
MAAAAARTHHAVPWNVSVQYNNVASAIHCSASPVVRATVCDAWHPDAVPSLQVPAAQGPLHAAVLWPVIEPSSPAVQAPPQALVVDPPAPYLPAGQGVAPEPVSP